MLTLVIGYLPIKEGVQVGDKSMNNLEYIEWIQSSGD